MDVIVHSLRNEDPLKRTKQDNKKKLYINIVSSHIKKSKNKKKEFLLKNIFIYSVQINVEKINNEK